MKTLLSTTSTYRAVILRVLQVLSSLVTLLTEKEKDRASSQNILPYIESFFLYACTSVTPQKAYGTTVKVDKKNVAFVMFSEKHRTLLNAFIRQNPGWLEKSFSFMLKVPRFIDFDNKRAHFQ
ncbi:hypothetical protein VNO78_19382 [Psophocarpus tetragonolobus]|uniref:Uncharacterized protein n=1 Tax=Psophocarpus tetragonolobus TaxID=3891 RepID=A0AAN9XG92_PSOTE